MCTLCTPPLCCVGALVASSVRGESLLVSGGLTLLGTLAFVALSVQCGKVDFVGGGGNPCWSAGSSKATGLGLFAAVCLGLGAPSAVYAVYKRGVDRGAKESEQRAATPTV